jgi:hypothetical protein
LINKKQMENKWMENGGEKNGRKEMKRTSTEKR